MGILDKLKSIAGQAKGTIDDQVDKYSDKLPAKVSSGYRKVSNAAEKVLPGADEQPEHEKIIKGE